MGAWLLSGLIEEIQRAALDQQVPVDSLLRRVKLAAAKLKLGALEGWVDQELNGYTGDIPEYRKVQGQPAGWHPRGGWIPIQIEDERLAEMMAEAPISQSCATLVETVKNNKSGVLHFPLPGPLVASLNEILTYPTARMVIQFSPAAAVGILDNVRNRILDWAIQMESEGVVGEGLTFTDAERKQAQSVMTTVNIYGNNAGHIGSGNSGDIDAEQTHNDGQLFASLAKAIHAGIVAGDDRELLLKAVDRMSKAQADKGAFHAAYVDFVSSAASYMTIVGPFLPALLPFLK